MRHFAIAVAAVLWATVVTVIPFFSLFIYVATPVVACVVVEKINRRFGQERGRAMAAAVLFAITWPLLLMASFLLIPAENATYDRSATFGTVGVLSVVALIGGGVTAVCYWLSCRVDFDAAQFDDGRQ